MSERASAEALAAEEHRRLVRERYGAIATESSSGCCSGDGCCGSSDLAGRTRELGYDTHDIEAGVEGANLGLGCGNPTAIASLNRGETVLDLGSGAGFDCFLAARTVGSAGRVLGVDMTPEMVEKARKHATENERDNVEFRLGEIEHLPVADETVDVVISNCVVNLSPNKQQVFDEAYRVLRAGGRLAISDVVQTAPFPDDVRDDPQSLAACVSGAATIHELEAMLDAAGFEDVDIAAKDASESFIRTWDDSRDLSDYLVSSVIQASKPRERE